MKPTLTKEESELYLKIVQSGSMDDMFNLGYVVGVEHLSKEHQEVISLP